MQRNGATIGASEVSTRRLGHATAQSLAAYRELALSDVVEEYEAAMRAFPVR